MTAARQVGATIGVAVLGTVLASVYRSHLSLAALPPAVAAAARTSVGTGVAVAARLGSAPLLDAVRAAYASGDDVMLWVCAAIALTAAVLAALFLPRQPARASRGGSALGRRWPPVQFAGALAAPRPPGPSRGEGLRARAVSPRRTGSRRGRMTGMTEVPARPDSLRERKKARTHTRCSREHALQLSESKAMLRRRRSSR